MSFLETSNDKSFTRLTKPVLMVFICDLKSVVNTIIVRADYFNFNNCIKPASEMKIYRFY